MTIALERFSGKGALNWALKGRTEWRGRQRDSTGASTCGQLSVWILPQWKRLRARNKRGPPRVRTEKSGAEERLEQAPWVWKSGHRSARRVGSKAEVSKEEVEAWQKTGRRLLGATPICLGAKRNEISRHSWDRGSSVLQNQENGKHRGKL